MAAKAVNVKKIQKKTNDHDKGELRKGSCCLRSRN